MKKSLITAPIIEVSNARKLLGKNYATLSDNQVLALITEADNLAKIIMSRPVPKPTEGSSNNHNLMKG